MAGLHNDHGLKGIALTGYGIERTSRSHKAGFIAHLTNPLGKNHEEILAEVFQRYGRLLSEAT